MKTLLLILLLSPVVNAAETKVTPNEMSSASSSTIIGAYNTPQTTFSSCVTGSTLTITTSGGRVMVGFAGSMYQSGQNMIFATYFKDGVSFGKGLSGGFNTSSLPNWPFNMSFTTITDPLTAGVHTFCLAIRGTAGTNYIYADASMTAQFWVWEIK